MNIIPHTHRPKYVWCVCVHGGTSNVSVKRGQIYGKWRFIFDLFKIISNLELSWCDDFFFLNKNKYFSSQLICVRNAHHHFHYPALTDNFYEIISDRAQCTQLKSHAQINVFRLMINIMCYVHKCNQSRIENGWS